MSDWLAVLLLGIVEGVTEFLPVSSTGHLLLTEHLIGRTFSEVFNVVIQCGAVLAVLVVFAKRAVELATRFNDPATRDYLFKLFGAFVITAVGGLLMKKLGLTLHRSTAAIAWATLIGGVLFLVVERWLRGRKSSDQITWAVAIAVGVGQLIAIGFPGASRSGTTILMALMLGLARPAAIEFSFLLGIPTLLAAGAKELLGALRDHASHEPWSQIVVGTVVAAVTAFAVVRWLLKYVQSHTFEVFGWYRVVLGVVILLLARVP
jgi:undecaprenyl-diphosphatase